MITSLSNPGYNRLGVGRSKPAAVCSKPAVARNRPAEEHNRLAAHNTAEDNTAAVAGNRNTPGRY